MNPVFHEGFMLASNEPSKQMTQQEILALEKTREFNKRYHAIGEKYDQELAKLVGSTTIDNNTDFNVVFGKFKTLMMQKYKEQEKFVEQGKANGIDNYITRNSKPFEPNYGTKFLAYFNDDGY